MATEQDKVNTGLLATISAVLALSVLGIALAVTALVRSSEEEMAGDKMAGARAPFDELANGQKSELTAQASWADKTKGTASVPIDRAMALVLKEVAADPNSATAPAPPPAADAGAAAEGDAGATGDAGETATDAGATTSDAGETASDAAATSTGDAGEAHADAAAPKKPKPVAPTPPAPPPEPPPAP